MSNKKCQNNENTFGGRLRSFRESMGFNILNFSALLGISHSSLSQTENNKTITSAKTISNLVQNTNINIYWLFTGEGEMTRASNAEAEKGGDGVSIYKEVGAEGKSEDIGFGQAAELLSNVFSSENKKLIRAITANLEAFNETVESQQREALSVQMLSRMETRMSVLENKLSGLNNEKEELKRRLDEAEAKLSEKEQKTGDPSSAAGGL